MPYLREQKTQNIKKLKFNEKQDNGKNNPPRNEALKPLIPSPINLVPFCEKSHAS